MIAWRVLLGLCAGVGLTALDAAPAASTEPTVDAKLFDGQLRPLLLRHCVTCHGAQKPKGKLRLDNLTTNFADAVTRAHWAAVIERLEAGEMPPKGKPRPPQADVEVLIAWLVLAWPRPMRPRGPLRSRVVPPPAQSSRVREYGARSVGHQHQPERTVARGWIG